MSRLPRFFLANTPLHVIVRGNNRCAICAGDDDREFLRSYLTHVTRVNGVAVHAYVLMTNHLHLLATPLTAKSLPRAMQMLGRTYVRYFNNRHSRTGTLWEGRYKAAIVDDERYLLLCMRYIELNPVRARMVAHPSQYAWSSFAHNALGLWDGLVTHHPLYVGLGADPATRQDAYAAAIGIPIDGVELERIRDATQYGWALGSDAFRRRIGNAVRRAERLPLGRPRQLVEEKSRL